MAGAKGFEYEENKVETEYNPNVKITEENGCFYLEMDMNRKAFVKYTEIVTTKKLPLPRITESPYENADGTEIVIDKDFLGNIRDAEPKVGPFENLSAGKQKILIWQKK